MRNDRSNRVRMSAVLVVIMGLAALFPGCPEGDPAREILKTRRLWKADLLGFVQREDGAISAQFRLSGPVASRLDDLTVKVDLLDVSGQVLASTWETMDLREVKRGGPVERFVTVPAPPDGQDVESIRLDPVHYPTTEDWSHILELGDLPPPAE